MRALGAMDVFSPGWSCQERSPGAKAADVEPGIPSIPLKDTGKWLFPSPLLQEPLPIPAARRLDVVSMEIDVRSAKNRASV